MRSEARVLCIGAGGLKALKLITALDNINLKNFTHVAGSSMGSIIALALALGFSKRELKQLALTLPFEPILSATRYSLLSPAPIQHIVETILELKGFPPSTTLQKIPGLGVAVSRLGPATKPVLLTNRKDWTVVDAILASTAIPGLFPPVRQLYVDPVLLIVSPAELIPKHINTFSILLRQAPPPYPTTPLRYIEALLNAYRYLHYENFVKSNSSRILLVEASNVPIGSSRKNFL